MLGLLWDIWMTLYKARSRVSSSFEQTFVEDSPWRTHRLVKRIKLIY